LIISKDFSIFATVIIYNMAELTIKTFNDKLHNIYIKGEVGEEMWSFLVDKINEMRSADEDVSENNTSALLALGLLTEAKRPPVNIYLSTYGGSIYDMFAIYDEIKKLQETYEVNLYCVGKIMSAGTIIMLAVDKKHRFAYPSTTFMFHTLSSFTYGKIKEMEEDIDEAKRLHNLMLKIYKENTSIPEDKLNDIYKRKKDLYMTAEQAKKYKIIDKIV